jgi:hypothetical protein
MIGAVRRDEGCTNPPTVQGGGKRRSGIRSGGGCCSYQASWTARQNNPRIKLQRPIQTTALKAKIGEKITNAPIFPNRPSWVLQYLAKYQIR